MKNSVFLSRIRNGISDGYYVYAAPQMGKEIYIIDYPKCQCRLFAYLPDGYNNVPKKVFIEDSNIICVSLRETRVFFIGIVSKRTDFFMRHDDCTEWQEIYLIEKKIWFFPRCLDSGVWYFNIETKEFIKDIRASSILFGMIQKGIVRRIYKCESKIFFIITDEKKVVVYDLYDKKAEYMHIPEIEYYDMAKFKNYCYFIERNKNTVYIWDEDTGKIEEISGDESGTYMKIVQINNDRLMLCEKSPNMYVSFLCTNSIEKRELKNQVDLVSKYSIIEYNGSFLCLPWNDNTFFELDSNLNIKGVKKIKIPVEVLAEKEIVDENQYGLSDFLSGIK